MEAADIATAWQQVHTVHEYYDGEIFGVADYEGRPHVYEAQWNDASQEYGPMFRLSEIEPGLLALVLEDWAIWLRWEAAFKEGLVTQETHPALPADRPRHEALKAEIGDRFEAKRGGPILTSSEFRYRDGVTEVRWRSA
jgi:hypothetical protein